MKSDNLLVIKKSKERPKEGDVFVLQPIQDVFYYGKVIQTNIQSNDSFINGMTLIYIYKFCSADKSLPQGLENRELLIPPIIVNNQPWNKGYFETIGNLKVSGREKEIDFAFWDVIQKKYISLNGEYIDFIPRYKSIYGLGSYGVIGKEVQTAIKELT